MKLTTEEQEILDGKQGEILKKIMKTLVRYGKLYGAESMVPLDGPVQMVCSFGMSGLAPLSNIMKKMVAEGLHAKIPFTVDPRPLDFANVPVSPKGQAALNMMYSTQEEYEGLLQQLGLKDNNAFTCACYLDEVGNIPKQGDNLAWAESSAVVYANSVLGARTNRTSGVMELFSGVLGMTPKFGFLTEDGRKADWIIELKTTKMPRPQILGSAIGKKVMEKVPYIRGLDRYLGTELTNEAKDYLKDMGAATASNGAVGLYHVEHLTPEAVQQGEALIRENAPVYVVDDAELERVVASYPVLWKEKDAIPERAFIGCPHSSYQQLIGWTETFEQALKAAGKETVAITTIITSAPDVIAHFKESPYYERLMKTGVKLSYICPLMYMSNPFAEPVITNSNKLRTYSSARYMDDQKLVETVIKGGM